MKVFISWSGPLGKSLAEALRQWLPAVIQVVRPYYTPDDIAKGARWNAEITKELEESQVGIICVTQDSLNAPWIVFEAGALSKNIDKSRVCPILFDLRPTDVQGPLVQFQLAQFEEKEMKRVIKMINEILTNNNQEGSLDIAVLDSVFEMWWPKLKEKVESILKQTPPKGKTTLRSDRELLEEILRLSRVATSSTTSYESSKISTPNNLDNIIQSFCSLVNECNSLGIIEPLRSSLDRMWEPLHESIIRSNEVSVSDTHDLLHQAGNIIMGKPEREPVKRKRRPTEKQIEKKVEEIGAITSSENP